MDFLKLIKESKADEFKSKYLQKFGENNTENIIKSVLPKYFDWVGRQLDFTNFDENLSKLVEALDKFEKVSTNLPITDLYQYKNIGELYRALNDYDQRQRRIINKVEGGNVVYDDDRYFVVNPLTHESSCYYGKGTKWCTSAETDGQFKRYNEDGKLFYILDRNLPTGDPYYKVALLRKFDGDKTFFDAKDETIKSGWIYNTPKLNEILSSIDKYLDSEYGEQIKIYTDKELAKKEKERLERLRAQRILNQKREDAKERKLDGDWDLDDNCPEVGLRAHALLEFLVDNNDVEAMTNEDRGEIARIENEITRLQSEYDNDEEVRTDLLNEIGDLEDELDELKSKIDVYNIIPIGRNYAMTEFEVIDSPGVEDRTYAVGDELETKDSAYESIENLIDDIGYEGFNKSFAENYIDEDAVLDYARDIFYQDIYDNPESYFDDDQRELSDKQEERIQILNEKISQMENMITDLEGDMDGENDEEIQERIDEMNEMIEEMSDEITEIEEDPDGDFPEVLYDDKIEEKVKEVEYNVLSFMNEWELKLEEFINKDDFIEGAINEDGYGHTLNSYDGSENEIYVQNELYYVMRIN